MLRKQQHQHRSQPARAKQRRVTHALMKLGRILRGNFKRVENGLICNDPIHLAFLILRAAERRLPNKARRSKRKLRQLARESNG